MPRKTAEDRAQFRQNVLEPHLKTLLGALHSVQDDASVNQSLCRKALHIVKQRRVEGLENERRVADLSRQKAAHGGEGGVIVLPQLLAMQHAEEELLMYRELSDILRQMPQLRGMQQSTRKMLAAYEDHLREAFGMDFLPGKSDFGRG